MQNNSQLELFSDIKDDSNSYGAANKPFLTRIRGYEKLILIIFGFTLTGIISFSLGVEKGKKNIVTKINSRLDVAQKKAKPSPNQNVKVTSTIKLSQQYKAPAIKTAYYTIQLASYENGTHAQKEAETLKKKGFLPAVLPKGRHMIICVGNFANQQTAQPLLANLRKRYKDCFIRRL